MALGAVSPLLISLLMFTSLALIACRTSDLPLSVTAEYEAVATELDRLRATATVARARLQITLDFAGTRVAQIEQSGAFLRSNLLALGTDSEFIAANLRNLLETPQTVVVSGTESPASVRATEAIDPGDAFVATPSASGPPRAEVTPGLRPRLDSVGPIVWGQQRRLPG